MGGSRLTLARMATLRDVGEFEAIRLLVAARSTAPTRSTAAPGRDGVIVGSGDDAAVLAPSPGFDLVATTDAFVEGRHYRNELLSPRERGVRLAAANLSDLAAMAARPRWALLSLGVRPDHEVGHLVEFQGGLEEAIGLDGGTIVGGNLVAVEGPEWASVTLLGECAHGQAWTRAGARAGDLVAITGSPGRAAAGLALLAREGPSARTGRWAALVAAWIAPRVRSRLAQVLPEPRAVRAAVDVSDGFAADLSHLCAASGVGAEVDESTWPEDATLAAAAAELGIALEALRFGPSDDYELILAVDPERRDALDRAAAESGARLHYVGRFIADDALRVRAESGATRVLEARGFDHFKTERG